VIRGGYPYKTGEIERERESKRRPHILCLQARKCNNFVFFVWLLAEDCALLFWSEGAGFICVLVVALPKQRLACSLSRCAGVANLLQEGGEPIQPNTLHPLHLAEV
jgi:hypothetical protein